jgi:hypothetical protein
MSGLTASILREATPPAQSTNPSLNQEASMSDELAHAVSAKLFLEPSIHEFQGTRGLKALNVRRFAQIQCAWEAAELYNKHLYNRPYFPGYLRHLSYAADLAIKVGPGLVLEFGVASGTTIRELAKIAPAVAGFDSFQGLPEQWRDGIPSGSFAGHPPEVPDNVSLHVGLIEDTLPGFLRENREEVRFLHIDTDLYEPAKFILSACRTRMIETVIVFDELFNYPGWRDHEWKAWTEFQSENAADFDFDYLGLGGEAAVSVRVSRK